MHVPNAPRDQDNLKVSVSICADHIGLTTYQHPRNCLANARWYRYVTGFTIFGTIPSILSFLVYVWVRPQFILLLTPTTEKTVTCLRWGSAVN